MEEQGAPKMDESHAILHWSVRKEKWGSNKRAK